MGPHCLWHFWISAVWNIAVLLLHLRHQLGEPLVCGGRTLARVQTLKCAHSGKRNILGIDIYTHNLRATMTRA